MTCAKSGDILAQQIILRTRVSNTGKQLSLFTIFLHTFKNDGDASENIYIQRDHHFNPQHWLMGWLWRQRTAASAVAGRRGNISTWYLGGWQAAE